MRKNKEKQMKRNNFMFIMGLVVLVVAAFMMPRLIFAVQDKEHMSGIGIGIRSGINFAALTEDYETSLPKRLDTFVKGLESGREYYVSEVAANLQSVEKEEILNKALFQTPVWFMDNLEQAMNRKLIIETWTEILGWKKYIIYDRESVSFICWYVEVRLDSGKEVKLLLDAVDGTVYFMRDGNSGKDKYENNVSKKAVVDTEIRNSVEIDFAWLVGVYYYHHDLLESFGIEVQPIQEMTGLPSMRDYINQEMLLAVLKDFEQSTDKADKFRAELEKLQFTVSEMGFSIPLYYGEGILTFEVAYMPYEQGGEIGFSIGIPAVGERIPEMKL